MYSEKLETILTRQNAEEMVKWLKEDKNTDRNHAVRLTLPEGPFYDFYDTVKLNDGLVEFKSTQLEYSEIEYSEIESRSIKKGPSIDEIKKLKEDLGFSGSSGGWMSSHNASVHSFSIGHAQEVERWLENYIRI